MELNIQWKMQIYIWSYINADIYLDAYKLRENSNNYYDFDYRTRWWKIIFVIVPEWIEIMGPKEIHTDK